MSSGRHTLFSSIHSETGLQYCDDLESTLGSVEEAEFPQRKSTQSRHSSVMSVGDVADGPPTPKIRFSDPIGKENQVTKLQEGKKKVKSTGEKARSRRSRVLQTLQVEAEVQNKPEVVVKKERKSTRRSASFAVFGSDEETDCEEAKPGRTDSSTGWMIPVKMEDEFQLPQSQVSPEYDPVGLVEGSGGSPQRVVVSSSNGSITGGTPEKEPTYLKLEPVLDFSPPADEAFRLILSQMESEKTTVRADNRKRAESENPLEAHLKDYTPEWLLKVIPDPWAYYSDMDRDCHTYADNSLYYLKSKFRRHYTQTISDALFFHNHNLYMAYKYLTKKNRGLRLRSSNRSLSECIKPANLNPRFLLEVWFMENRVAVMNYMKDQRLAKGMKLKEAARTGLLVKCDCCCDANLLKEDVVRCAIGHTFCKNCVVRYFESGVRNGWCIFECLAQCKEKYPLILLQDILRPELFSRVLELYRIFERNDIPGLVRCPHCWFVTILSEEVKVVKCLNPGCLQETCRVCKRLNHEPFGCPDEGGRSSEVGVPVGAGRALAFAPVRTCWKCKLEITKEDCCNEMICTCGGKTCYVCGKAVKDHSHYYLYEDESGTRCPLYSADYTTYAHA